MLGKPSLGNKAKNAWLEPLRAVELFSDCTDRQLAEIDGLMTEIPVAAGTVLIREARPGREFFIIREGTAAVTRGDTVVRHLHGGGFFGELALLDRGPRTATVTAATDMRVWVLNRPEFVELLDRMPAVARQVRRAADDRRQPSYTTTPRTFFPAAMSSKASLIPSSG